MQRTGQRSALTPCPRPGRTGAAMCVCPPPAGTSPASLTRVYTSAEQPKPKALPAWVAKRGTRVQAISRRRCKQCCPTGGTPRRAPALLWRTRRTVAVLDVRVKHGLVVEGRQAQHAKLAVQVGHVGVDGRACGAARQASAQALVEGWKVAPGVNQRIVPSSRLDPACLPPVTSPVHIQRRSAFSAMEALVWATAAFFTVCASSSTAAQFLFVCSFDNFSLSCSFLGGMPARLLGGVLSCQSPGTKPRSTHSPQDA